MLLPPNRRPCSSPPRSHAPRLAGGGLAQLETPPPPSPTAPNVRCSSDGAHRGACFTAERMMRHSPDLPVGSLSRREAAPSSPCERTETRTLERPGNSPGCILVFSRVCKEDHRPVCAPHLDASMSPGPNHAGSSPPMKGPRGVLHSPAGIYRDRDRPQQHRWQPQKMCPPHAVRDSASAYSRTHDAPLASPPRGQPLLRRRAVPSSAFGATTRKRDPAWLGLP